jgi:hypothetical protein
MKRAIVALGLLAVACGTAPTASSSAVVLTEGHIAVDTSHFVAGEVTLAISNAGEFAHTLVVTEDGGAVLAATGLIGPGEQTTLEVDLVPGSYQFSCRIVSSFEGEVFDHYQLGMMARVEVSGAAEAAG